MLCSNFARFHRNPSTFHIITLMSLALSGLLSGQTRNSKGIKPIHPPIHADEWLRSHQDAFYWGQSSGSGDGMKVGDSRGPALACGGRGRGRHKFLIKVTVGADVQAGASWQSWKPISRRPPGGRAASPPPPPHPPPHPHPLPPGLLGPCLRCPLSCSLH